MATPKRVFNIRDLLALIAASGLGLYLARESVKALRQHHQGTQFLRQELSTCGACVLAAWTIMLLLLRLHGPRPTLRRLATQPGFAASCAAALSLAIGLMWNANSDIPLPISVMATLSPSRITRSVASALAILALSGGWRSEPSWIDRLGRALAVSWVLIYVVYG
jgi:hypothetical protein